MITPSSYALASGRLPGKALAVYCPDGTNNLSQIISRWKSSRRSPAIIVSTTTAREDDSIERAAELAGASCYRGHLTNVIDQMDGALKTYAPNAAHIARALADNPLVDVGLADWRYDVLCETGAEGLVYTTDNERITYAGTTDIWSRAAWDGIVAQSSGSQLEHPGAYYWDNLNQFNFVYLQPPPREYLANVRTELDTPQDLEMFRELWNANHLYFITAPAGVGTTFVETDWALRYLEEHPDIAAINASIHTKTQTHPAYTKGLPFLCKSCQRRTGTIVSGDLVVSCPNCGKKQKYYSRPPDRHLPQRVRLP